MKRAESNGFKTHVLGCKVNFADAQRLLDSAPGIYGRRGALVATCCVTAEGTKQSRKQVRRASRELGEDGVVFVTGCASRHDPAEFDGIAENVIVLDDDSTRTQELLRGFIEAGPVVSDASKMQVEGRHRTRHFLKVQDGCANHCSYCIIPHVRGLPESRQLDDLVAEAEAKIHAGFPELVVSGINVGDYRDAGEGLEDVMQRISRLDGLLRLRLSSIEVLGITRPLLETLADCSIFARHLHIPIQSGDDRVLGDMGRRYSSGRFRERVELARSLLPGVNITTDAIVGFPGEDETAFEKTMGLVEECGITKVHVFPFSPRPGTEAAARNNMVKQETINERSLRLRQFSDRLGEAHRRRKVGGTSEVLLESPESPLFHSGLSGDYTRFSVSADTDEGVRPEPGMLVKVSALSVNGNSVMGKVIN